MKAMSNELKQECIDVIQEYTGVQLTNQQFADLLTENPRLNKQLIKYNSPRDTMDRECMIGALAVKIVGRDWPTYGEGAEVYNKFIEDFQTQVHAQGYTVVA
jgi:hypothetical protein